jgi:hypothetical protein
MSRMKYLWAAALIALCVGVFAGAALAAAVPSWNPTANTITSPLIWDQNVDASITATNDGLVTWDSTISIWSVLGSGGTATAILAPGRWGLVTVPVSGTVVTDASYTWDFAITAPPITTLQYPDVTPTTTAIADTVVAATASFDCNWDLALSDIPQTTEPTVSVPVTISRFGDVPGTNWAVTQVEQCAGRIPFIVNGYDNGTYRPLDVVTRGQMAVFVDRALQLGSPAYTKNFSDVAAGYWADNEIQAVVDATIVFGYEDNTYRPEDTVTRDQMAVYMARGMAGGDANVTAPEIIAFNDVVPAGTLGHWAFNYINYCAYNNVVNGYTATTYAPTDAVSRDQMAVFVYRGFVAPTGAAVALAGPAITAVNPATATYDGWTSLASASASGTAYAYVGLDAVRLQGLNSAVITFELCDAVTPTIVAASSTVTWDSTDIANALDAVIAGSGNPYAYASWNIPLSMPPGNYILVTFVNGKQSQRQPAFTLTP